MVYGRGTQDMKGIGVCHYIAMKTLKNQGVTPKRTIHLIAVPDEEIGGFKGCGQFVQTQQYKALNIGYVLDEGLSSNDPSMLYIKVSERRPMQIRFTINGTSAHGSKLMCTNVLHVMIDFLSQITSLQKKQQTIAMTVDPGSLLSINITSCHAGELPCPTSKASGVNIVPGSATATVDIRIPSDKKQCEIQALLDDILSKFPMITYEVLAQVDEYETPDVTSTEFYQLISSSIHKQGLIPKNLHFEATTDLRHYIPSIHVGCGLTPFTIKDNLHGIDECISISDLLRGSRIFMEIIRGDPGFPQDPSSNFWPLGLLCINIYFFIKKGIPTGIKGVSPPGFKFGRR